MDDLIQDKLAGLAGRAEKERRRFYARRPKAVGSVLSAVIAKRGYAAVRSNSAIQEAWRSAAARVLASDSLVGQTRAGVVRRGRLEVTVANHVVMQEINFHKPRLLSVLQQEAPSARIESLRFRVGRL